MDGVVIRNDRLLTKRNTKWLKTVKKCRGTIGLSENAGVENEGGAKKQRVKNNSAPAFSILIDGIRAVYGGKELLKRCFSMD